MKEDVLEQLVEDYLHLNGYFTQHNVRFKPPVSDSEFVGNEHRVSSDIDVIGVNPRKRGPDKVRVVSCKSWQKGFDPALRLGQMRGTKRNPKREVWRHHRELWVPIWARCFRAEVEELTGQSRFHYQIAVTKLTGEVSQPKAASELWATDKRIQTNLAGSQFSFLEFQKIWSAVYTPPEGEGSKSPAASNIGRLAQLMKAAGIA